MNINKELVERLAHLSRLQFDEQGKEQIVEDLKSMIGFVDQIADLDLSDVEPLIHMSEEVNDFRSTDPEPAVLPEDAVKNAPDSEDTFFRVPKVL